jgi:hypothetical protein
VTGAATRDASWYNRPDVHRSKVVHADNGDAFAVCNPHTLMLGPTRWENAADVPARIRCKRPACARAYREADHDR